MRPDDRLDFDFIVIAEFEDHIRIGRLLEDPELLETEMILLQKYGCRR